MASARPKTGDAAPNLQSIIDAPIPATTAEIDAQIGALDAARLDRSAGATLFGELSTKVQQLRFHRGNVEAEEQRAAAERRAAERAAAGLVRYDERIAPLAMEQAELMTGFVVAIKAASEAFMRLQALRTPLLGAWNEAQQSGEVPPSTDASRPRPTHVDLSRSSSRPPNGRPLLFDQPRDVAAALRLRALHELFGDSPKNVPEWLRESIPFRHD